MKAQIGVDARSGITHRFTITPAHEHEYDPNQSSKPASFYMAMSNLSSPMQVIGVKRSERSSNQLRLIGISPSAPERSGR